MTLADGVRLAIAVILSEAAGVAGSFFTAPSVRTWYPALAKPGLAPPDWVFAPVWTALFALMGIAAFLIWRKGIANKNVRIALGLFAAQLALNILWSAVFFGWHALGAAFAEILVLWAAIVFTICAFARVSRAAAWLLLPYVLWVTFAAYLTYSFWMLN